MVAVSRPADTSTTSRCSAGIDARCTPPPAATTAVSSRLDNPAVTSTSSETVSLCGRTPSGSVGLRDASDGPGITFVCRYPTDPVADERPSRSASVDETEPAVVRARGCEPTGAESAALPATKPRVTTAAPVATYRATGSSP